MDNGTTFTLVRYLQRRKALWHPFINSTHCLTKINLTPWCTLFLGCHGDSMEDIYQIVLEWGAVPLDCYSYMVNKGDPQLKQKMREQQKLSPRIINNYYMSARWIWDGK